MNNFQSTVQTNPVFWAPGQPDLSVFRMALFGLPIVRCDRSVDLCVGCRLCHFVSIGDKYIGLRRRGDILQNVLWRELDKFACTMSAKADASNTFMDLFCVSREFERGLTEWQGTVSVRLSRLVIDECVPSVSFSKARIGVPSIDVELVEARERLDGLKTLVYAHTANTRKRVGTDLLRLANCEKGAASSLSVEGSASSRSHMDEGSADSRDYTDSSHLDEGSANSRDYTDSSLRDVSSRSASAEFEFIPTPPEFDDSQFEKVHVENVCELPPVENVCESPPVQVCELLPVCELRLREKLLNPLSLEISRYEASSCFPGIVPSLKHLHAFALMQSASVAEELCVLMDKVHFQGGRFEYVFDGVHVTSSDEGLAESFAITLSGEWGQYWGEFIRADSWEKYTRIFRNLYMCEFSNHCVVKSWLILTRWENFDLCLFWWRVRDAILSVRDSYLMNIINEDELLQKMAGHDFFKMRDIFENWLSEIDSKIHSMKLFSIGIELGKVIERAHTFDYTQDELKQHLEPIRRAFE